MIILKQKVMKVLRDETEGIHEDVAPRHTEDRFETSGFPSPQLTPPHTAPQPDWLFLLLLDRQAIEELNQRGSESRRRG